MTTARGAKGAEGGPEMGSAGLVVDVGIHVLEGSVPGVLPLAPPIHRNGQRRPATVMMQPMPLDTRACHYMHRGGGVTAIRRKWAPGDSGPHGRCRLCEVCSADSNECLIVVGQLVKIEDCPTHSTVGLADQRSVHAGTCAREVK